MLSKLNLCLLGNSVLTIDLLLDNIREFQVHEINKKREVFGEYHHLFPDLRNDDEKFFEYMRMSQETFDYILQIIEPHLIRNWCNFHTQPILPEERLVLTLRFLATGSDYKSLAFAFRVGSTTVCDIVTETMQIIWNNLYEKHMPAPTREMFLKIAEEFFTAWDIPHCIGAIDGKHVQIKNPDNSGSLFFNFKKFFSIVLQALVDANYKFITIDVGGYGQQSDGGTFQESSLYEMLKNGELQIPPEDSLHSDVTLPYFMIGDAAYPLMENLMKPYPGENLPKSKEIFNKRLSRARRVVECAFGILAQKWRILFTKIYQKPKRVDLIIKCISVLHNVIIDLEGSKKHLQLAQQSIANLNEVEHTNQFITGYGVDVRNELTKYFIAHPLK